MKNKPSPKLAIFITVFIDMLGVGIIIPIFAPLIVKNEHGILPDGTPAATLNLVYGILAATFAIFQFFGAPILGSLADRFGRRKVLLISIAGTMLGYLLFGLAILWKSLFLLFWARAIPGFTGGNIAIVLAALADISDEKDKAKNFGLVGMAFGLGFILGPFIGGKLADPNLVSWFSYDTPLWFTALLAFVNILLVIRQFPETFSPVKAGAVSLFAGFNNIKRALAMQNMRIIFLTLFLQTFGFSFFMQFFQVFLIKKFDYSQSDIGMFFGYIGIWIAFTQGVVTRIVAKYYKPSQVLQVSLFGLSAALMVVIFPSQAWLLFLTQPFVALFQGVTQPNITSVVSSLSSKDTQGEILGIQQSIQSIGFAIPPLIAGVMVTIDFRLPIIMASVMTMLAGIVFVLYFKPQPTEK